MIAGRVYHSFTSSDQSNYQPNQPSNQINHQQSYKKNPKRYFNHQINHQSNQKYKNPKRYFMAPSIEWIKKSGLMIFCHHKVDGKTDLEPKINEKKVEWNY